MADPYFANVFFWNGPGKNGKCFAKEPLTLTSMTACPRMKLKPHHVLFSDVRLEPSLQDRRDRAQTPALNTLTGMYYDIPRTPEIG